MTIPHILIEIGFTLAGIFAIVVIVKSIKDAL